MTDSPPQTPSSVHAASVPSPQERSPIITGISALSSPSDESHSGDAAAASPPHGAAVEEVSDDEERKLLVRTQAQLRASPAQSAPAGEQGDAPVHITAADYADRRRLLNHITYLSTQLQRAQLQVEDLTRTVCIVRGAGNNHDGIGEDVQASIAEGATSSAVLAARDEADVHAALQAALAVFDPVIAQTQIYRLDDALAQMGLLREAELAQLRQSANALQEHRTLVARLSEEVAHLRSRNTALQQQKESAETQLTAATLEVARLRQEELRLNQRVAGLQELAQDGTWMSNVRVVGAGQDGRRGGAAAAFAAQLAQLVEEEQRARQELLLDIFWEPMLIAFDAGVTWITDSAALRTDAPPAAAAEAVQPQEEELDGAPTLRESERLALIKAGIVMDAAAPPSDADLLLLRRQQEEVTELRARVQLLQDRGRVVQLENERLQYLYENEMRRSERMAQDHVAQLQQAYDEVVKDRQLLMHKLKGEVEEQLRLAFEDGRAYERSGARSRSRPSKKVLRASKATS